MLEQTFFHKRFSVGLALDTNLLEFNRFLEKYAEYIDNFYFSLPLGDKFHARSRVVEQMHNPDIVRLFWELLKCIRSYGIKLELVLNNGMVSCEDVKQSAQMLEAHGIKVDLVGITDDIYEYVKRYFPSQELVFSFKNHAHTEKDFALLTNHYDEIVLGRQNIRNTQLFSFIQHKLNTKVVLLLNNGCSHICGGCTTLKNCHRAYYQAKFRYDSEYLYALQSVLPFEIHSGLLDTEDVCLFKISSRNASVEYIEDCLKSYIFCIEESYIRKSTENYALWSRLAWHSEYFDCFSLERIKAIKKMIYLGDNVKEITSYVSIILDFRNYFLFTKNEFPKLSIIEQNINALFGKIPCQVDGYLIGVSNCTKLLKAINRKRLDLLVEALYRTGRRIYFSLPPISQADCSELSFLWDSLGQLIYSGKLECVVVNDFETERYLVHKLHFPVALGERITKMKMDNAENDYMTGNERGFGKRLISEEIREECMENDACFVLCNMPEGGLCISASESLKIQVIVGLIEEYDGVCRQFCEKTCDRGCLTEMNRILQSDSGDKLVLCANSICSVSRVSDGILKTILENRASIVLPLIWKELL